MNAQSFLNKLDARQRREESAQFQSGLQRRQLLATTIRFLTQNRGVQSVEVIRGHLRCSPQEMKLLEQDLSGKKNIAKEPTGYRYRPEMDGIMNKADLRRVIASRPEGIRRYDLRDAYWKVGEDIDSLIEDGLVDEFGVSTRSYDMNTRSVLVMRQIDFEETDEKILEFWKGVMMPSSLEDLVKRMIDKKYLDPTKDQVVTDLSKSTAKTSKIRKRKRRKKQFNITNSHLA